MGMNKLLEEDIFATFTFKVTVFSRLWAVESGTLNTDSQSRN